MQGGQGVKEEIRLHLENVNSAAHHFEEALQALPACSECARVALLEHIRKAGNELGSEVISLSALAETLKGAVSAAESFQSQLTENPPSPCRCKGDPCSCHSGP